MSEQPGASKKPSEAGGFGLPQVEQHTGERPRMGEPHAGERWHTEVPAGPQRSMESGASAVRAGP
jgi:hypothetical protein